MLGDIDTNERKDTECRRMTGFMTVAGLGLVLVQSDRTHLTERTPPRHQIVIGARTFGYRSRC